LCTTSAVNLTANSPATKSPVYVSGLSKGLGVELGKVKSPGLDFTCVLSYCETNLQNLKSDIYYVCNMTAEICHQFSEYECEWKPEEITVSKTKSYTDFIVVIATCKAERCSCIRSWYF
jgi:tRNA A37 threonylcarbamoyladenosine biosynthesis protein TsaE